MHVRRIELDEGAGELRIVFPYDQELVAQVKTLPGRRWDPEAKSWRVPAKHAREVLDLLLPHDFEPCPEVTALAAAFPDPAEETLTVRALNERVQAALRRAFPESLWVLGEIHGLARSEGRRHRFFELVEKEEGTDEPAARVRVVAYEEDWERLVAKAAAAPEPFELTDGIQVRLRVRVDLYPRTGVYELIAEDLDPVHTAGRIALERQRILQELTRLGLRERNRALPFPPLPLRVAVITSRTSDAWNDIRQELARSGFAFHVTLFDARVQGRDLKPTVLGGLRYFAERAADFDVLLLARGGGSRAELLGFDDLEIARAVAAHPLKVVCGIGHERDRSVLDEIAHSEKTPTAAAGLLVARVGEALAGLEAALRRVGVCGERELRRRRERLGRLGRGVAGAVRHGVLRAAAELRHREERLAREAEARVRGERRQLLHRLHRVVGAVRAPVVAARERWRAARRGLRFAALRRHFAAARERLGERERRLRALDPRRVVRRGYGILRAADGRVLTRAHALRPGEAFGVEMRDGTVHGRAERIEEADDGR